MVVYQIKPLSAALASHMATSSSPGLPMGTPTLIWYMADLEEAPASRLQTSPILATVAIWAVNKQVEDLCFSL